MDAGSSGFLGETLDKHFHFLGRHIHEICKFIYNNEDIGHFLVRILLIIAFDISHLGTGKELVPCFHFPHSPVQGAFGLLHVGNDFGTKMGNAIVYRKFYHLRVDKHEFHVFRTAVVNDTGNNGINAHRFTGTRGACNEKMRHFCQIRHHRLAGNILA